MSWLSLFALSDLTYSSLAFITKVTGRGAWLIPTLSPQSVRGVRFIQDARARFNTCRIIAVFSNDNYLLRKRMVKFNLGGLLYRL